MSMICSTLTIFTPFPSGIASEPEFSRDIYYTTSKITFTPKDDEPTKGESPEVRANEPFDEENVDEFVSQLFKTNQIGSIDITFKLKLQASDQDLLEELESSIGLIRHKINEQEKMHPGLRVSKELPDGGIAGYLLKKNDRGDLMQICAVTKKGRPLYGGYGLIPLNDDSQLKFRELILEIILNDDFQIVNLPLEK